MEAVCKSYARCSLSIASMAQNVGKGEANLQNGGCNPLWLKSVHLRAKLEILSPDRGQCESAWQAVVSRVNFHRLRSNRGPPNKEETIARLWRGSGLATQAYMAASACWCRHGGLGGATMVSETHNK